MSFDASGSYDNDGIIDNYDLHLGDGDTDSGVTVTHAYSSEGSYTVTLTVTDNDGLTDNATQTVTVTPARNLMIYAQKLVYAQSPLEPKGFLNIHVD